MKNKHLGSSFGSFLEEEGLYSDVEAAAIKRVLAYQAEQISLANHSASKTKVKKAVQSIKEFQSAHNLMPGTDWKGLRDKRRK